MTSTAANTTTRPRRPRTRRRGCLCSRQCRLGLMLCLTTLFFGAELIFGHMVKSNALVADSFHMLSDNIAIVVAIGATFLVKKNPLVFARAEVLGGFTNAVFLVALCFSILVDSVKRILEPEPVTEPLVVLAVGILGLLCNGLGLCILQGHGHDHVDHGQAIYSDYATLGRQLEKVSHYQDGIDHGHGHGHGHHHDHNIRGVFLHVLADFLGSIVVVVSALVIHFYEQFELKDYVDPMLSITLSLLMSVTTWPLLKQSAIVLLQDSSVAPGNLNGQRADLVQPYYEHLEVRQEPELEIDKYMTVITGTL